MLTGPGLLSESRDKQNTTAASEKEIDKRVRVAKSLRKLHTEDSMI